MRYLMSVMILGAGLVSLGACTAPSQGLLNQATMQCSEGYRQACAQLPMLNAQVQQENQNNQVATGVAAGLGGLVGGALIGGAVNSGPYYGGGPYYYHGYRGYYHRCYRCW